MMLLHLTDLTQVAKWKFQKPYVWCFIKKTKELWSSVTIMGSANLVQNQ